jgi:RIO-like serine/threonine protein kinase
VFLSYDTKINKYVVIKEARPYTGFYQGNDAVCNLYREWQILREAYRNGVSVPKPIDFFFEWEHAYIVMEYINLENIREYMLVKPTPVLLPLNILNQQLSREYFSFWKTLFENIVKELLKFHSLGVWIVDFSPLNILSDPHGNKITWIDFEASVIKGDGSPVIFTPGHGFISDPTEYDLIEESRRLTSLMAYIMI